jgi:hypothetical protein
MLKQWLYTLENHDGDEVTVDYLADLLIRQDEVYRNNDNDKKVRITVKRADNDNDDGQTQPVELSVQLTDREMDELARAWLFLRRGMDTSRSAYDLPF